MDFSGEKQFLTAPHLKYCSVDIAAAEVGKESAFLALNGAMITHRLMAMVHSRTVVSMKLLYCSQEFHLTGHLTGHFHFHFENENEQMKHFHFFIFFIFIFHFHFSFFI
jgi:hypothetical protein